MKILKSGWFAFALLAYLLTPVHAQDKKQLQQNVERTFKTHEPDLDPVSSPVTDPSLLEASKLLSRACVLDFRSVSVNAESVR